MNTTLGATRGGATLAFGLPRLEDGGDEEARWSVVTAAGLAGSWRGKDVLATLARANA